MKFRRPYSRSQELISFSVRTGVLALGLYGISMTCRINDFLNWVKKINPQRGTALDSALLNHSNDELALLRSISQLTDKEGQAVARKVAAYIIKGSRGKLHQHLLEEARRTTTSVLLNRKKD